MEANLNFFDGLVRIALECGAWRAAVIDIAEIETDRAFRDMCAANACGAYARCWMCPPDVGDIGVLMGEIRQYGHALVYQTVSALEDSYDYESMVAAKKQTYALAKRLRDAFDECKTDKILHLGAGGCGVCEICAKRTNEPCRYPALAMPSLEAYGINVSRLATAAGMKYTNGANTVTYFGAVLFSVNGEAYER